MPSTHNHELVNMDLKGCKVEEILGHRYLWMEVQSCPIISVYMFGGPGVHIASSDQQQLKVCGLVQGEHLWSHPPPA